MGWASSNSWHHCSSLFPWSFLFWTWSIHHCLRDNFSSPFLISSSDLAGTSTTFVWAHWSWSFPDRVWTSPALLFRFLWLWDHRTRLNASWWCCWTIHCPTTEKACKIVLVDRSGKSDPYWAILDSWSMITASSHRGNNSRVLVWYLNEAVLRRHWSRFVLGWHPWPRKDTRHQNLDNTCTGPRSWTALQSKGFYGKDTANLFLLLFFLLIFLSFLSCLLASFLINLHGRFGCLMNDIFLLSSFSRFL